MTTLTGGDIPIEFGQLNLARVLTGQVNTAEAGVIRLSYPDGSADELTGTFRYDASGALAGGTLTGASETLNGRVLFSATGVSLPVETFVALARAGDNAGLLTAVFAGADVIKGSTGADVLRGYAGDDRFVASGGADTVDGGAGSNTLQLGGAYSAYVVTSTGAGAWTLVDGRAGSPDGRITATSVQKLEFLDGTLTLATPPSAATVATLDAAFANLSRAPVNAPATMAATVTLADGSVVPGALYTAKQGLIDLAVRVDSGAITLIAAQAQVAHLFDSTTSVATLAYQFFTGRTPLAQGYDYLVSSTGNATDLNDPYYARFTAENRYINFAVNLGRYGEGRATFEARYGALSLTDTLKAAYQEVFGFAADDAKVSAILNAPTGLPGVATRADYLADYGGDGPGGVGTKAALVGYLLVEAVKADLGTYARANDAFLAALAAGSAQFNVDLKAAYGAAGAPLIGLHDDGSAW